MNDRDAGVRGSLLRLAEDVPKLCQEPFSERAVQRPQRFVEHEKSRLRSQGARQGNPLLFPAR